MKHNDHTAHGTDFVVEGCDECADEAGYPTVMTDLAARAATDSDWDDPVLDGTDGAHPAWWRGCDYGYFKGCQSARARMSMSEFVWRVWHRLRWGHPYFTTHTGSFDHRKPCYRCTFRSPRP